MKRIRMFSIVCWWNRHWHVIKYKSAAVPKFAEQRVITAINTWEWIHHLYVYSGFVVFCWILLFVSFSCRIRQCFCTSTIRFLHIRHFLHQQKILHMRRFTVRSYEYWAGQHWILSWMEENQTGTFFLRSIYVWYYEKFQLQYIFMFFLKSKFRSYIGKLFLN